MNIEETKKLLEEFGISLVMRGTGRQDWRNGYMIYNNEGYGRVLFRHGALNRIRWNKDLVSIRRVNIRNRLMKEVGMRLPKGECND